MTKDQEMFLQARRSLPRDHALMIEAGSAGKNTWPDEDQPKPVNGNIFTKPPEWTPDQDSFHRALRFVVREARLKPCVLGVPIDDAKWTATLEEQLEAWTREAQQHRYTLVKSEIKHDGRNYGVIQRDELALGDNGSAFELF